MKVLFVDDETMVLSGLRRAMYKTGWKIKVADSPFKALEMIESDPPDIVVSDVQMPGMNGVDMLEKFNQALPDTSRFVLSGQADAQLVLKGSCVSHGWFAKPCSHDVLIEKIGVVIGLRETFPDVAVRASLMANKTISAPFRLLKQGSQCVNGRIVDLTSENKVPLTSEDKRAILRVTGLFKSEGDPDLSTLASLRLGMSETPFFILMLVAELNNRTGGFFEQEKGKALVADIISSKFDDASDAMGALIAECRADIVACLQPDYPELNEQNFLYLLHLWNVPYPIIIRSLR